MLNTSYMGVVFGSSAGNAIQLAGSSNDVEVVCPPDDSVSALEFSPSIQQTFLASSSWDSAVRCWEVLPTGQTVPKAMKQLALPLLDLSWCDDGKKIFVAGGDRQAHMWDLLSDQLVQVAEHDNMVKTCHWVKAPNYSCLMTGSWDKTLKFWDTRSPQPMLVIVLPERVYCADVLYPAAVVVTADQAVISYSLQSHPTEVLREKSPLECQSRCIAITTDKYRNPTGYAIGGIKGRVAMRFVYSSSLRRNFSMNCHRSEAGEVHVQQDVYAVNDVTFHPENGILASAGANGDYCLWNIEARRKVKQSEAMGMPITKCAFSANGCLFAYALGYDREQGYENNDASKKPKIFLHSCYEEIKGGP